jgi:hypothetical protein
VSPMATALSTLAQALIEPKRPSLTTPPLYLNLQTSEFVLPMHLRRH